MSSELKHNYIPQGINILVSKILPEATSKGGIILPERALTNDNIYTVVAIGDGRQRDGNVFVPNYKVGDKVFIPGFLGTPLSEDGNYKIVPMDNAIAIVEDK